MLTMICRYWVVLAGGQLCEYSNWKEKLDLHNEPINLRMASVREARNQERRFCFEVITPQYKRVYQATSEDDMSNWITAINNAVKGMLEGGKSTSKFDASKLVDDPSRKDISQVFGGKTNYYSNSGYASATQTGSTISSGGLQRRITVGSRPQYNRRSSTFNDDPEKLLQLIRNADPANSSCADCGSQVKTEWVSINLGIVLCIGMYTTGSRWMECMLKPSVHRMLRHPSFSWNSHLQSQIINSRHDVIHT